MKYKEIPKKCFKERAEYGINEVLLINNEEEIRTR